MSHPLHLNQMLQDHPIFRRLRQDDLMKLLDWRNSQQSVLRQQSSLTPADQAQWWREHVLPSYASSQPRLFLLALDRGDGISSYGGLTNIDWVSRRAEVSFLAEPQIVKSPALYRREFLDSLLMYFDLAFSELELHRLFTETWSFRRSHIDLLESVGFQQEGVLRQHVVKDGQFFDAVIHGLLAQDWRTL